MSGKLEYTAVITLKGGKIRGSEVSGAADATDQQTGVIAEIKPLLYRFVRERVLPESRVLTGSVHVIVKFREGGRSRSLEFKVKNVVGEEYTGTPQTQEEQAAG